MRGWRNITASGSGAAWITRCRLNTNLELEGRAVPIGNLDHYSIRALDVEASRRFYTEVMGFAAGFRPAFDFPGVWLYSNAPGAGSNGVVHIIGIDPSNAEGLKAYLGERGPGTLEGTGTVDHMAFTASDADEMRARLERNNVPYRERTVPNLGLHQIFFEDPSRVTIELNFRVGTQHAA